MNTHDRLPHALTSFVGRKREAGRVRTLVLESRLLTLTGPGGSGKTRLATEVAAKLTSRFRDGVFLAELAPLGGGTLVDQVVASVLGVAQLPGRHLAAALSDHLRPRQLLLVIDNCEHLVAKVASLVLTMRGGFCAAPAEGESELERNARRCGRRQLFAVAPGDRALLPQRPRGGGVRPGMMPWRNIDARATASGPTWPHTSWPKPGLRPGQATAASER